MRSGFSLVELSIVLVILGLLTGGILSGQSLIRAAELRSVSSEFQRYTAAVQTFRDKYMAIPGDMPSATRFWGRYSTAAWCLTNSAAAVNASTGTCDGNSTGTLQRPAAASQSSERFQFWRQLALAGLVEGTYNGLAGSGSDEDGDLGDNMPGGKMGNTGWHAHSIISSDDAAIYYNTPYGNGFLFGGVQANGRPQTQVLKPEEAWNIDTKMDDGRPAYGKVIAGYWNNACAVNESGALTASNLNARYKLEDTSLRCVLMFRELF